MLIRPNAHTFINFSEKITKMLNVEYLDSNDYENTNHSKMQLNNEHDELFFKLHEGVKCYFEIEKECNGYIYKNSVVVTMIKSFCIIRISR